MTVLCIPFILLSLINIPSTLKKKEIGLFMLLTALLIASIAVIYIEIKTLLDAGIPLI